MQLSLRRQVQYQFVEFVREQYQSLLARHGKKARRAAKSTPTLPLSLHQQSVRNPLSLLLPLRCRVQYCLPRSTQLTFLPRRRTRRSTKANELRRLQELDFRTWSRWLAINRFGVSYSLVSLEKDSKALVLLISSCRSRSSFVCLKTTCAQIVFRRLFAEVSSSFLFAFGSLARRLALFFPLASPSSAVPFVECSAISTAAREESAAPEESATVQKARRKKHCKAHEKQKTQRARPQVSPWVDDRWLLSCVLNHVYSVVFQSVYSVGVRRMLITGGKCRTARRVVD